MKNLLLLAFVSICLMVVTGCASTHINTASSPLGVVLEKPMYQPEMELGSKIEGEATIQRILFIKWGANKYAEDVDFGFVQSQFISSTFIPWMFEPDYTLGKRAASYDAIQKNGSDAILAPHYLIEDNDYIVYQKTNYKVSGIGAKIKSLKQDGYSGIPNTNKQ